MPYFSNREIREALTGYEPAQILEDGKVLGPRCCDHPMAEDSGCSEGCCDDYRCSICGYTVRIEWPD